MPSFCELNLNVTNLSTKAIEQLVETAIKLGYDELGLAIDYEFPDRTQLSKSNKGAAGAKVNIPEPVTYTLSSKLEKRLQLAGRKVKLYTRINIKVKSSDINSNLHHLKSKPVQIFDLISLEPVNNQVFMYLCTNNFNVDIISVNSGIECGLTDKHLIRPIKSAILNFSLTFEINYSSAITSSTERRDLIMLGRCLAFNSKLKGLIISSGTSQKCNLRGPYELLTFISRVKLFDISDKECNEFIRTCPHYLLNNSFCRKHTAAGMVYFNDLKDLKQLELALIEKKQQQEQNKDEKLQQNVNDHEDEEKNESNKKKIKNG